MGDIMTDAKISIRNILAFMSGLEYENYQDDYEEGWNDALICLEEWLDRWVRVQ